jgi:hypothetical protein
MVGPKGGGLDCVTAVCAYVAEDTRCQQPDKLAFLFLGVGLHWHWWKSATVYPARVQLGWVLFGVRFKHFWPVCVRPPACLSAATPCG